MQEAPYCQVMVRLKRLEKLEGLVKKMRAAQRNYFSLRRDEYLTESKRLEKKVDETIFELENRQTTLL